MEGRTTHRSVRDRSHVALPTHSFSETPHHAPAMPSSPEEVQLLYERVERLGEQASIAEQLQRENDELRAEVHALRGEMRVLRRENVAFHSRERADASDMVVTESVLTALHESERAQQTNREAMIALRRHHAAQLAERDVEIGRLQNIIRSDTSARSRGVSQSTVAGAGEFVGYEHATPKNFTRGSAGRPSVRVSMSPVPASPVRYRSTSGLDGEGWSTGGLS